jgi:hypothetical protein
MEMNEEWLPNRGETICNLQGISSWKLRGEDMPEMQDYSKSWKG